MEEADALSDRIAVMNHGEVKCCGSPIFLKKKFGSGYRITLTKGDKFSVENLASLVSEVTGRPLNILSNMAKEMCFGVEEEISPKLPELLNSLENYKTNIDILNYGISSATIEEVFLKYVKKLFFLHHL